MRIVRVSKSLVGKVVARTVYAADGRTLLGAGTVLTPAFIDGLIRWGYSYIAVEDELLKGLEPSDVISEVTRVIATSTVQNSLSRAARGETIDHNLTTRAVEDILNDVQSNEKVVVSLHKVRSFDDYTFVHSVNVCVLTILLGQGLNYHRFNLTKLATGALLHDVGKIRIPSDIINKPGKLSPQEFEIVKTHPMRGFELLSKNMSFVSAHVALQHHERIDGSGYPRGLQDESIHEFGKIAAVADVYDALTSDRPYRKAMTPAQAMAEIGKMKNGFDLYLVDLLKKRLALYWEGSIVSLNDRRIAVVLKQTTDPARPVIRVLSTSEGKLAEPEDIDLRNAPELEIVALLDDYPEQLQVEIEKNFK